MFSSKSDRLWSAVRRGGAAVDGGAKYRERCRGRWSAATRRRGAPGADLWYSGKVRRERELERRGAVCLCV